MPAIPATRVKGCDRTKGNATIVLAGSTDRSLGGDLHGQGKENQREGDAAVRGS